MTKYLQFFYINFIAMYVHLLVLLIGANAENLFSGHGEVNDLVASEALKTGVWNTTQLRKT